ncbi:hypothetical protein Nepgr_009745 [Nepenthes gracilis]|uniref:GATA transcription factor n=1 Tax=Nepenthes gracilis TaxID=150966 RepID=A0AAD3XKN2_NEPGR|nr:hypothetical protein Nepgr_009745 [Nepenthes gracilis]
MERRILFRDYEQTRNLKYHFRTPLKEGRIRIERMIGTNFIDEIDCGSFFDHVDDFLEFPFDDFENGSDGGGGGGDGGSGGGKGNNGGEEFKSLFPSSSIWCNNYAEDFTDSIFSADNGNITADFSAELPVPYEDVVQLEWLSNFVQDSFSAEGLAIDKAYSSTTEHLSPNQFLTSSPVSVLESSSSCSNGKTVPLSHEKRARTKRPHPATFNPRPDEKSLPFVIPNAPSELENFAESRLLKKTPKPSHADHKKKKKIKITNPAGAWEMDHSRNQVSNTPAHAVRKCLHCEITKTPQWRAGPMGPKTLCNACGVRYKSGRLFPEYRPAASPTFAPSLHSNSHKKVLEMRSKNLYGKSGFSGAAPKAVVAAPTA